MIGFGHTAVRWRSEDQRLGGKYTVQLRPGKHNWRYERRLRYLIELRRDWIGKNKSYYRRIDFIPDLCLGEPTIRIDGVDYTCDTLPKKWWGKMGKYTGVNVVVGEDENLWKKIVIDGWQPPSEDLTNEGALKQHFTKFINEVGFLRSAGKTMTEKDIVSIFRKSHKKLKYSIISVALSSSEIGRAILFNKLAVQNLNSRRKGEGLPVITINRQDRYSEFETEKRYLHGLCNYLFEKKGYDKGQIRRTYDSPAEPTVGIKGKNYTRSELPKELRKKYEEYWKKEMKKSHSGTES